MFGRGRGGAAMDRELDGFISRLEVIQTEAGGPASGAEARAKNSNKDDFTRIAEETLEMLVKYTGLIEQREGIKSDRTGGFNVEQVQLDNEMRRYEAEVGANLNALEALQRKESAKRRSKIKPDQMEHRAGTIRNMRRQHDQLKARQRKAVTGRDVGAREHKTMESSELFKGGDADGEVTNAGYQVGMTRNNNMTEQQRLQLEQIKARDKQFDDTILAEISAGLDRLQGKAEQFGERLNEQDRMIDEIQVGVDGAHEKLLTVNAQLKETLQKLRGSDRICLDIVCVLVMLGLVGVIIQVYTSNN